MPETIRFDKFDLGLDLRRSADTSGANQFRTLDNCYISTGKQVKKRPGLTKIASLEPGTKGLKGVSGKLQTFSRSSVPHAHTRFNNNVVPYPSSSTEVVKVRYADAFNGFIYAIVEYADGTIKHNYLDGTSPPAIVDANCPHSKSAVKMASKIFAIDGRVVRFSATGLPRDWTTASNAGFMATGLQQQGATTATWVGEFQKQLVVAFADGLQVWDVDPDPVNIRISQRLFNIGSPYSRSPTPVGGDLFFLSDKGFRSIFVTSVSDNLQDSDIGSPIDSAVKPTLVPGIEPMAVYYADIGQYWNIINKVVWVYSYSRSSKITAWSRYTEPFTIDDATVLAGEVYVRSDDNVYQINENSFTDDGTLINVDVLFSFLDFKAPGNLKQIHGVDIIASGSYDLSFLYDPRDPTKETLPVRLKGNTTPGAMLPVELTCTHIAPRFRHSGPEDFSIDAMVFYYDKVGPL